MTVWIPRNPNAPKRNRKRNKHNEVVPMYIPDNMPVVHITRGGKGWVGRLIRRNNNNVKKK